MRVDIHPFHSEGSGSAAGVELAMTVGVNGRWYKTMSKKPDIQLKRAYLPAGEEDGERILVDRLWPRGVSKEKLAATWLKDIAPSTQLRKWFHSAPEQWEAFARRYREELDASPEALARLRAYLAVGRVTFVYGTRDEAHNHAVVLRDYVLRRPDKGIEGHGVNGDLHRRQ